MPRVKRSLLARRAAAAKNFKRQRQLSVEFVQHVILLSEDSDDEVIPVFDPPTSRMPSTSSDLGDRIAKACLDTYKSLGTKGKPLLRKDGVREWSVLAGFVLHDTETDHVECVSLGSVLSS